MWVALRRDRAWWLFVAVLVILNLPYLLPIFDRQALSRLMPVVNPIAITAILAVLLYRVRELESEAERAFWFLTAAGYSCWWLSEILLWLFPGARGLWGFHLTVDSLYLLLFMLILAAAEMRPDLGSSLRKILPLKSRIEVAGLLIALITVALYWVVIPSRFDPEHYGTWVTSLMLYATLDFFVAVRFIQLSRQARSRRWRVLYSLVALTMVIWYCLDSVDAMVRAGWFSRTGESASNLFWNLPLLTLAMAACLRRHRFEEASGEAREEEKETGGIFRSGSPLIAMALLLPMMHNGLSASGVLLPIFQPARNWLIASSLACLGGLLLIENFLVRKGIDLERQRQKRDAAVDLKQSEERFRTLADATFEGVIVHDGSKILDANEQLAQIFGFPLEQVIGSPLGVRVAAGDRDKLTDRLRQPGNGEPLEFQAFRRNREPFIAEVRSRDLLSLGPGVRVAVFRDITEYRRLEEDLRQAQKMDAVGRLAGGIAHDFNNLLTVILGSCDLMAAPTFERDLQQIRQAAKRAAAMTQQLLAFSRPQGIELETLDLNDVVLEAEPLLRRLLPESIALELDLEENLGMVEADRGQMAQVILNLVINGRDSMPRGGRLCIATSQVEVPPSSSESADSNLWEDAEVRTHIQLSVVDIGTGISTQDLPKIFDPFFTTKDEGKGTGLGLATVFRIVQASGGSVEVDTEVGQGTTFHMLLPASLATVAAEPASDRASLEGLRGSGTVLVVEDQPEIGQIIQHFLSEVGFEVICVTSGLEAFEAIKSQQKPITLLIADVVLPNVGGPEVVARLRSKWRDLPALYMSGYTEGPWIEAIEGEPMLRKPFARHDLLEKVQQVLGMRLDTE